MFILALWGGYTYHVSLTQRDSTRVIQRETPHLHPLPAMRHQRHITVHQRSLAVSFLLSPRLPRGVVENRLNSRQNYVYSLLPYACIYSTRCTHNTMPCRPATIRPFFGLRPALAHPSVECHPPKRRSTTNDEKLQEATRNLIPDKGLWLPAPKIYLPSLTMTTRRKSRESMQSMKSMEQAR